jgi:hypothetical protein
MKQQAFSITQLLEFNHTQPLWGVAGRIIDIEDPTVHEGRFSQKAKMTDKDKNGPIPVIIQDESKVLDKRLEGLPVFLLSEDTPEGKLRGVGLQVNTNSKNRRIAVRNGARILIYRTEQGKEPYTLTYDGWMRSLESAEAAAESEAAEADPEQTEKPNTAADSHPATEKTSGTNHAEVNQTATPHQEPTSHRARATPDVIANIEVERGRRARIKDLQNAFATARANAQAVLVCHLEAHRWAHMMKSHFGEVLDSAAIAAMKTNFIMRNCANGTNIVGLMPARRKERTEGDLGFEIVIREHERFHGYKLSESEFTNMVQEVPTMESDYVSTISKVFAGKTDLLEKYMREVLRVKFEDGQTWRDADEAVFESIMEGADDLLESFNNAP